VPAGAGGVGEAGAELVGAGQAAEVGALARAVLETKKVMSDFEPPLIMPQAASTVAAAVAASRGTSFERIGFSSCWQSKRPRTREAAGPD
jgi:hypothetical protein